MSTSRSSASLPNSSLTRWSGEVRLATPREDPRDADGEECHEAEAIVHLLFHTHANFRARPRSRIGLWREEGVCKRWAARAIFGGSGRASSRLAQGAEDAPPRPR